MCTTILSGVCCHNVTKVDSNSRDVIIKKAIAAISINDSIELFRLIDTSYCFDIYGKDGFISLLDFAYNRFKVCNSSIHDSLIKTREKQQGLIEYALPFCREGNGEVVNGSFDLLFSFSDYSNEDKILFMDILKYRQEIKPTKPVGNLSY